MSVNSNKPAMTPGSGYNEPYLPIIPAVAAASAPTNYQATAPSPYNSAPESGDALPDVITEFPPSYSATPSNKAAPKAAKKCDLCHSMIDISMKQNYCSVKCNNCQEVTAMMDPPPGKKHIRCQCNCLMTINATAVKIKCPRENCRRITELGPLPKTASEGSPRHRVVCSHCHYPMITRSKAYVRCPKCKKISSVNGYVWWYGFLHLGMAFIFLTIGVVLAVFYESASGYSLAVSNCGLVSFILAVYFFFMAGYYLLIEIIRPPIGT